MTHDAQPKDGTADRSAMPREDQGNQTLPSPSPIASPMGLGAGERTSSRPWRTNIGLRLSAEDGAWFTAHCERENRPMANMVELLIKREREALTAAGDRS